MQTRVSAYTGFSIEATDGKVGTVSDFLFDDSTWQVRWVVVDTGGWLADRKILIQPAALEKPDVLGRAFSVNLARAQVEASPSISTDEPVSLQMEHDLYGYYGWPEGSLTGQGVGSALVMPMVRPVPAATQSSPGAAAQPKSDPHLRSVAEVSNYSIHALDGSIGHLETLLINEDNWSVSFLVIDTANWWIGRHVLVSPSAVKQIDWSQRFIALDLTCYKIKSSPVWENTGILDRAYEEVLRLYYGWSDGDAHTSAPPSPAAAAQPRQMAEPVRH